MTSERLPRHARDDSLDTRRVQENQRRIEALAKRVDENEHEDHGLKQRVEELEQELERITAIADSLHPGAYFGRRGGPGSGCSRPVFRVIRGNGSGPTVVAFDMRPAEELIERLYKRAHIRPVFAASIAAVIMLAGVLSATIGGPIGATQSGNPTPTASVHHRNRRRQTRVPRQFRQPGSYSGDVDQPPLTRHAPIPVISEYIPPQPTATPTPSASSPSGSPSPSSSSVSPSPSASSSSASPTPTASPSSSTGSDEEAPVPSPS